MGYSDDPEMVRVDFFKSSGKWYCTEAVKWTGKYRKSRDKTSEPCDGWDIHAQLAKSLRDHFKDTPDRLSDTDAVCLEPYHENSHPIQIKQGGWRSTFLNRE